MMTKKLRQLFLTALLLIGVAPLSYGNVPHAASSTAVYGGKFEDVLKRSLVSEASAAGFAYIGHNLYENPAYKDMNLPPKVVVHGLVGGALAQLSGGDFTSGAIATATADVVGEHLIGPLYADRVIKGEMSSAEAKRQIDLIAATVAGAVTVMANGHEMSDRELSAAMAMAHSVVDNNYLNGFDAYVAFGKGIVQGGGEKAWNDLKAAGLALSSPIKTVEAIGTLLSSAEAMKGVAKGAYDEIVAKYNHVKEALTSAKAYGSDAGGAAGKDAGKLLLMIGETYGGVKGFVVAAKSAGRIVKFGNRYIKKHVTGDVAKAGHVKPEGNYSGLNDPVNTYRAPSDNKLEQGKGVRSCNATLVNR